MKTKEKKEFSSLFSNIKIIGPYSPLYLPGVSLPFHVFKKCLNKFALDVFPIQLEHFCLSTGHIDNYLWKK